MFGKVTHRLKRSTEHVVRRHVANLCEQGYAAGGTVVIKVRYNLCD